MRRFLLLLFFPLLVGHLLGGQWGSEARRLSKKVTFPVIETPAVFTGTIDDSHYLVFVEYSDSQHVRGHYMSLEEPVADTLPFQLEARKRNARLYYNGEIQMGEAIYEKDLDLHLDVFMPQNDTLKKRPLVMLVHGGAFYFGSTELVSM